MRSSVSSLLSHTRLHSRSLFFLLLPYPIANKPSTSSSSSPLTLFFYHFFLAPSSSSSFPLLPPSTVTLSFPLIPFPHDSPSLEKERGIYGKL